MATITVLAPDYESATPESVRMTERSVPVDPIVITVLENAKHNAKELLGYVADGLRHRLPVADVVMHSKASAGKPIDADVAEMLAARSHMIVTGLGD